MLRQLNHIIHTRLFALCVLPLVACLAFYSQDIHTAYSSSSNPYEPRLKNIASNDIAAWANSPIIINAIRLQNAAHNTLSLTEIEKLDRRWRLQANNYNRPLIEQMQQRPLSQFLVDKQLESDGLYREIMVIDNRGLIVGNSVIASDYWQGDEDKWIKTFKVGSGAIFIDEVKYDDSAQAFQSQVSITISDGDEPIGSITVGVDVEKMEFNSR